MYNAAVCYIKLRHIIYANLYIFGKLIHSAFHLCHVLQDMTKNNTFSCHGNMTNDNSHKIAKLKIYLLPNLIAIFDEKTGFFGLLRE